jgi:hypothetical protein
VKFNHILPINVRPIQIHSWGGFGSQVNALLMYWHVKDLSQRRPAKLIFHSSGLTRREPEILKLLSTEDSFLFIDDFGQKLANRESKRNLKAKLVRGVLQKSKVVIFSDNKETFSIKPWTFQLRGSYTNLRFSQDLFLKLLTNIRRVTPKVFDCVNSSHYRAGDLLLKKPESLVNPNIFFNQLSIASKMSTSGVDFDVFSESSDLVDRYIHDFSSIFPESTVFRVHSKEVDSLLLVLTCIDSETFVGTSSKLSILIAILRALEGRHNTRLPKSLERNFKSLTPEALWEFVDFYEIRILETS